MQQVFLDFHVQDLSGVYVNLHGLGPLNWPVKRALRALLRRHLREYLEREGRDLVAQELRNATTMDLEQQQQQSGTSSFMSFLWPK